MSQNKNQDTVCVPDLFFAHHHCCNQTPFIFDLDKANKFCRCRIVLKRTACEAKRSSTKYKLKRNKYGGPSQTNPQLFCSIGYAADIISFSNNKPYEDAFLLHQKYVIQGQSAAQIGKHFFCSKGAIIRSLIKFGISVRRRQEKGRSSIPRYGSKFSKCEVSLRRECVDKSCLAVTLRSV